MDVIDAAYRIAHEYPGGLPVLATRMKLREQILRNKVLPGCDTNHLTLREALTMEAFSGRADILFAHADTLGYLPPLLKPADIQDDVGHALASFCAEFADYIRQVESAYGDKRVTPNERKRLEKELGEMIAAALHLQGLLATKTGR